MTGESPSGSHDLGPTGPGDGGPCPICGEDMAEKIYLEELATGVTECSGRYWHMKNEHGVMEDSW